MRFLPALLIFYMGIATATAQPDAGRSKHPDAVVQSPGPAANPGRPTVSTPATLTPVGYVQFESGYMGAWHSPEFSSQSSLNEVAKLSITSRIQLLAAAGLFAYSRAGGRTDTGTGDVSIGAQGVLRQGRGASPTFALSYFRRAHGGDTPDLDIGSAENSVILLASADVRGFHCDTNYFFNEATNGAVSRVQFGQTLSVSHVLGSKFGAAAEIWHFNQPFLASSAVGVLWALNYNLRENLVLDGGFNRGLTNTSTRWEVVAGFTYLLPHKIRLHP
jgi:hypothetical protein